MSLKLFTFYSLCVALTLWLLWLGVGWLWMSSDQRYTERVAARVAAGEESPAQLRWLAGAAGSIAVKLHLWYGVTIACLGGIILWFLWHSRGRAKSPNQSVQATRANARAPDL